MQTIQIRVDMIWSIRILYKMKRGIRSLPFRLFRFFWAFFLKEIELKFYSFWSYWRMKQRRYICVHLLILFALNSYFIYILVNATQKYPNWVVTGSMNDFFGVPDVAPQLFFMNFSIMCGAIAIYVVVGILVKFRFKAGKSLFF